MEKPKKPRKPCAGSVAWLRPPPPAPPIEVRQVAFEDVMERARALGLTR